MFRVAVDILNMLSVGRFAPTIIQQVREKIDSQFPINLNLYTFSPPGDYVVC